ncbi:exportin 5 [Pelomyxa schiedti]|nr:exportin 5 [Pelomyxa schiedti]
MSMDGNVFTQIYNCLAQIHDPNTDPQARRSANSMCESISALSNCAEYAVGLLTWGARTGDPRGNSPFIHHFGLHLLEQTVKATKSWHALSPEDKLTFKNLSWQTMFASISQPQYIKEKAVQLVVEVARREWPTSWPELFPTLFAKLNENAQYGELVVKVLGELFLEIKSYCHKVSKEAADPAALTWKTIFQLFKKLLEENLPPCLGSSAPPEHNLLICKATFSALLPYSEGASLKEYNEHCDLINVLCQTFSSSELQMSAAENLLVLVDRPTDIIPANANYLTKPLCSPYYDLLKSAATRASGAPPSSSGYSFFCRIAQILDLVGTSVLSLWTKNEPSSIPPQFQDYCGLMLAFFGHPSPVVSSLVVQFWSSLLRTRNLLTGILQSVLPNVWEQLLTICLAKIQHITFATSGPQKVFVEADFDAEGDFHEFFMVYRAKVLDLLRQATIVKPQEMLQFSVSQLQKALSTSHNTGADISMLQNQLSDADTATNIFSCSCSALAEYFTTKHHPAISTTIDAIATHAATLLFTYQNKHPEFQTLILTNLEALCFWFSTHPEALPQLLQKIFSTAQFFNTGESDVRTISTPTYQLRRRALLVLLRLALAIPQTLSKYLTELIQLSQQLLSQNLLDSERISLFEALSALSNTMPVGEQLSFLDRILDSALQDWCNPEITSVVSGIQTLVNYVTSFSGMGTLDPGSYQCRKKLFLSLATILHVWRRCNVTGGEWVLAPQIGRVMGNLFVMVQTLHSMWNPSLMASLPPLLYKTPDSVVNSLMGVNAKKPSSPLENLLLNLEHLRENAYIIGGIAAMKRPQSFFAIPGLPQMLQGSFLSNLEHANLRHLMRLIRAFIQPLVNACRPSEFSSILQTIFPQVLSSILAKLRNTWRIHIANSQTDAGTPTSPSNSQATMQEEIIEDKALRDLTQEYFSLLRNLVSPTEKKDLFKERSDFVLKCPEVHTHIIASIVEGLGFPDTSSLCTCLLLAQKVYTLLPEMPGGAAMMSALLEVIFRSVRSPSNLEFSQDHLKELAVIVQHIITCLGPTHPAVAAIPEFNPEFWTKLKTAPKTNPVLAVMRTLLPQRKKPQLLSLPLPAYVKQSSTSQTSSSTPDITALFESPP